jgi:hypothetical protein
MSLRYLFSRKDLNIMRLVSFAKLAPALICTAALLLSATPAVADVETFATFTSITPIKNIRFVNSGTSASRTTNAQVYTTSSATANAPGTAKVYFSFLQDGLSSFINNVVADYTLTATVARGQSAGEFGSVLIQPLISGTMTFRSTSVITLTSPYFHTTTYQAGANLLTVEFGTSMTGNRNGSTTTLSGSTAAGNAIAFSSDFLDFSNVSNADLSTTFSALSNLLQINASTANSSLSTFRATAGGQFSSDPAPLVLDVLPEPLSWVMMVTGFAMLGTAIRHQQRRARPAV